MKLISFLTIIFTAFMLVLEVSCRPGGIITDFIRNNVAGPPLNFEVSRLLIFSPGLLTISWPIDPDAGLRRRTEYEALNGRYGYKHVERVGLGEDGRTEERRLQQRLRDEAGALSYQPPP